ncbi:hypothetical protein AMS68_004043 [Peltaster fructicola]|uniref:Spindle pole body-associated protein cut12 domain-containing protein n=1 Tax=Peltaster fructicola TaxID=286661 RepID=A0A6H0XV18_9PEZI|nr:hypothetical protein AMS68_004043 [Peltaster fructicola]
MSARIVDFPPSPTKGILLTPGTVGGRGKTVTFGDHIRDNDSGKSEQATVEEIEPGRKRVDPFDALEASESCEKKPEYPTGRYWKREYDIYRENTSKELRKLITKQKAAKSFAREKDDQCSALSEELQRERQNVRRLESRALELEMAMKGLQAQLADRRQSDTSRNTRYAAVESSSVSPLLTSFEQVVSPHTLKADTKQGEQSSTAPNIRELPKRPLLRARHDSLDPEVPGIVGDQTSATHKALYKSNVSAVGVSETGTSLPYRAEEAKENSSQPMQTDDNNGPADVPKSVVSREGEVIPPDRVAAARARLAARRQQRIAA